MAKHKKIKIKEDEHNLQVSSRRSFLTVLWVLLGMAAVVEFAAVIINFIGPGRAGKETDKAEGIIEAGNTENFRIDSVNANIQGKFYLCRMEDGGFLALSSRCTHLGCIVPWDDRAKKFACPCHGSSFDIRGCVISSPAPRPLDIFRVYIENNIVKVDISRSIKREKFIDSQVVYPGKAVK